MAIGKLVCGSFKNLFTVGTLLKLIGLNERMQLSN